METTTITNLLVQNGMAVLLMVVAVPFGIASLKKIIK